MWTIMADLPLDLHKFLERQLMHTQVDELHSLLAEMMMYSRAADLLRMHSRAAELHSLLAEMMMRSRAADWMVLHSRVADLMEMFHSKRRHHVLIIRQDWLMKYFL